MAIQNYIGWSNKVNRIILDSTTITLGNSATKQDETVSGIKRSQLRGLFCPTVYSVTMEFDWETPDSETGLTELQEFYLWYQFKHKYGTVPFEFPQILYSPVSGVTKIDEISSSGNRRYINNKTEFYKITSTVEGSKTGSSVEVKMTWESVYTGIITIPNKTEQISAISASGVKACVDVVFSHIEDTAPVSTNFTLYIDDVQTPITGVFYDGAYIIRLYFNDVDLDPEIEVHIATIAYNGPHYVLNKDVFTSSFIKGDDSEIYYP